MFFEKEAISIDKKEDVCCPICNAKLVSSNDIRLPLFYSGVFFIRLVIFAIAFAVLLWLFANPAGLFLWVDKLNESLRSILAAILCVVEGFVVAYLLTLFYIKLGHLENKQRIYGFYCRDCKKAFVGIKEIRTKTDRKKERKDT